MVVAWKSVQRASARGDPGTKSAVGMAERIAGRRFASPVATRSRGDATFPGAGASRHTPGKVPMVASLLWLLAALALASLGAELLVRGSVVLARRLRVSAFFIGVTLVGFGTSTPELFTSLVAARRGAVDLAVGNVVGSNIFNIALILGITSVVIPIPVRFAAARSQIGWALVAGLVPFLALTADGRLPRPVGAILLAALALYVVLGYRAGRSEGAGDAADLRAVGLEAGGRASGAGVAWLGVVAGLALLLAGSELLVGSASDLARWLGVSELAIGLTVVAAGTSAPELFTSLVAALRRQPDISIGNILGSNVFNLLGILGLTSLLSAQAVDPQILGFDAPLMVGLTLALIPILRSGSRIARGEGAALLGVYAIYLWLLFTWAPTAFAG